MSPYTFCHRVLAPASLAIGAACSASIADQPPQSSPPLHEHALQISPREQHPAARVPASVQAEHEHIHAEIVEATQAPGRVGEAARELLRVLQPHFEREEQMALPPLGLLVPLAAGDFSPAMQSILPMTDALRTELPQMLREHVEIAAAARRLEQVSAEAGARDAQALAQQLLAHAQSEEEVFYPAAILAGEVVRARAQEHARPSSAR